MYILCLSLYTGRRSNWPETRDEGYLVRGASSHNQRWPEVYAIRPGKYSNTNFLLVPTTTASTRGFAIRTWHNRSQLKDWFPDIVAEAMTLRGDSGFYLYIRIQLIEIPLSRPVLSSIDLIEHSNLILSSEGLVSDNQQVYSAKALPVLKGNSLSEHEHDCWHYHQYLPFLVL